MTTARRLVLAAIVFALAVIAHAAQGLHRAAYSGYAAALVAYRHARRGPEAQARWIDEGDDGLPPADPRLMGL